MAHQEPAPQAAQPTRRHLSCGSAASGRRRGGGSASIPPPRGVRAAKLVAGDTARVDGLGGRVLRTCDELRTGSGGRAACRAHTSDPDAWLMTCTLGPRHLDCAAVGICMRMRCRGASLLAYRVRASEAKRAPSNGQSGRMASRTTICNALPCACGLNAFSRCFAKRPPRRFAPRARARASGCCHARRVRVPRASVRAGRAATRRGALRGKR